MFSGGNGKSCVLDERIQPGREFQTVGAAAQKE